MERRVFLDLTYLREVWQLRIAVKGREQDHPCILTHITPGTNRVLVGQSVYLEYMTLVRQPNEAVINGCDLD